MENIQKIKDFYLKNKDRDQLVVSLKEDDVFKFIEEMLQFSEHRNLKCVRDVDRWNMYFSR